MEDGDRAMGWYRLMFLRVRVVGQSEADELGIEVHSRDLINIRAPDLH
jgi:hypothetical protein